MGQEPSGLTAAGNALRFGDWALDARAGTLTHRSQPAQTLRPKTAAVLAELLATPGVLVSRDRLLDRVWPGVTVTDDSVTQCIAEIRRTLGEDGRWLRTAPRRGYVFDAPPSVPTSSPAAFAVPAPAPTTARSAARMSPRRRPLAAMAALVVLAGLGAAGISTLTGRSSHSTSQDLIQRGRAIFYGPGERSQAWTQARGLFLQAHEAAPDRPEPDAWAVFTYTNMVTGGYSADPGSDLAEASILADRAVAHGPQLGLTWAARASVYRLQRRPAEAFAAYRHAVSLDPAQLPAKANAAWMLVLLGRPQEALEPIRAVLAAAPKDHAFRPTWLCYLGIAQFDAGDGDLGAESLRSISGVGANDTSCALPTERQLYLAAALALQGDVAQARALVADVRQQQPGFTAETLRKLDASDNPDYAESRETLLRAIRRAGFTDRAP